MQINLWKDELDELVKAHRSAAIRAAAAGDMDKARHHETRAGVLIETGGYDSDDPDLRPGKPAGK
jgi:hypothetical protein